MPPKDLPSGAKKIYTAAEAAARSGTCKDSGERVDECANRVAWAAVKKKYKKVGDKWVPKAETFSMAITNTSYDKATDTRRWKAVASDTNNDLYNDNMTLALYDDFLQRIESKELPPESFRSEFWDGGIPYLSISHYPDFNGKGVPGPVDVVYVDGEKLKASGRFDDTPIGKEVFKAVSRDISDNVPDDEKVRISIAFLDWMHRHKSNGFTFDRAESKESFCPECIKELITGESEGKEFLRGHLVHLALTRVPVNVRTKMEVERSMTTRKEDAESIIGEELAEELEEEAQVVGKSQAIDGDPEIVIKAEEEIVEEGKHDYKDEEEDDEEDKKKKKKEEMKSEVVVPDLTELELLKEIKAAVVKEPEPSHPLDVAISELKSVYDEAVIMEDATEALVAIQEPFEALALVIQNGMVKEDKDDTVSSENTEISELKSFMMEQFALMQSQISAIKSRPQDHLPPPPEVPERRSVSMNPSLFYKPEAKKSETPKLQSIVRNSVGLDN